MFIIYRTTKERSGEGGTGEKSERAWRNEVETRKGTGNAEEYR